MQEQDLACRAQKEQVGTSDSRRGLEGCVWEGKWCTGQWSWGPGCAGFAMSGNMVWFGFILCSMEGTEAFQAGKWHDLISFLKRHSDYLWKMDKREIMGCLLGKWQFYFFLKIWLLLPTVSRKCSLEYHQLLVQYFIIEHNVTGSLLTNTNIFPS